MKKKILVVDDIIDNIKVVLNYLSSCDYTLFFATNGLDAIEKIKINKPDLILMDIMMPELNGFEVASKIKQFPQLQKIPIIFLTAKTEPEDIVKGFEAGGVDYILKPINKHELLARIKTHLDLYEYQSLLEEKIQKEIEEKEFIKKTQKQLIQSEKMASLGNLVTGVAHEINTPIGIGITAISHFCNITDDISKLYHTNKVSEEEFDEYLKVSNDLAQTIQKNLDKASSIVKSFKKIAVDRSSEMKRDFNLCEYLSEVILSLKNEIEEKNINIIIKCDPKLILNSYPGAFSHIISNLILNSIQHGFQNKKEGEIIIEIIKEEKYLKLIYKDNGNGINEEILSKIFEPFFTTNRIYGGKGLGLSVIYNIVTTTFNGKISCNSTANSGVEFTLLLEISN